MARAIIATLLCLATACATVRAPEDRAGARRPVRVDVTGPAPELAFEPREPHRPDEQPVRGRARRGMEVCGGVLEGCGGGELCGALGVAVLVLCLPVAVTAGVIGGALDGPREENTASTAECVAALELHLDAKALRVEVAPAVIEAAAAADVATAARDRIEVVAVRAGLENPVGDEVVPFFDLKGRLHAAGGAGNWVLVRGRAPERHALDLWAADGGTPLRAGIAGALWSAADKLVVALAARHGLRAPAETSQSAPDGPGAPRE